jgi:putative endonuclease
MKVYYVYILECLDKSYYTGITSDLEKRILEHKNGLSEKCYTYSRRPIRLKFVAEFQDVNDAIAREKQIKGWSRRKKQALIENNFSELVKLSDCHPSTSSG